MKASRAMPTVGVLRSIAAQTTARPRIAPPTRCLRSPQTQSRTFLRPPQPTRRTVENLDIRRMRQSSYQYHSDRRNFLIVGAVGGLFGTLYGSYLLWDATRNPVKLDSKVPDNVDPFSTEAGTKRKTIIHDEDGKELVPTGNSTVKTFPRTIDLVLGAEGAQEKINGVEYTLVGMGVRTVSFLGFEVYMVGYYMATQDIAAIQARLTKKINPIATTLVANEKDELRQALLDPVKGEELWTEILQEVRPRSAFRIVPIRDTDFHHLRDAFVRAIQARSNGKPDQYGDEEFGKNMKEFRAIFNRGKMPKNKELLLIRDAAGTLTMTFGSGKKRETIGQVPEERITRLLWLNWLGGPKVASEPARQNIVHGIMEFVERPVGTVATQVV